MNDIFIIKKRLFIFLLNIVIVFCFTMSFLNNKLMPIILEYGLHQSVNISTKIVNSVVSEVISEKIKNDVIIYDENDKFMIELNAVMLNSINSIATKKIQNYFYKLQLGNINDNLLENIEDDMKIREISKGIIYEIPLGKVFDNLFLSNIGVKIPIRYEIVGDIYSNVISDVKEYGINNALIEINLEFVIKTRTLIPILSDEKEVIVSTPIIMKLIQGKIPDFYYGTNVIGGIK